MKRYGTLITVPTPPVRDAHFGPSLVLDRTIALINAVGPPAKDAPSIEIVRRLLQDHGEPDPVIAIDEIPALVHVVGGLFDVCAADSDAEAARAINNLFLAYGHTPRLTAHDGTRWHLHLDSSDDAPLHEWIATSGALALATMLSEAGRDGWGICRADNCGRLFLRTGHARRRTACSDRCATRARVSKHRRRHTTH
jgi:hypothetical protein